MARFAVAQDRVGGGCNPLASRLDRRTDQLLWWLSVGLASKTAVVGMLWKDGASLQFTDEVLDEKSDHGVATGGRSWNKLQRQRKQRRRRINLKEVPRSDDEVGHGPAHHAYVKK